MAPYRVLDLTNESGFLCGKILGDLGADVIKIEPPGGDTARHWGPFSCDRSPSKNLYWLSYNANKRGITLNLECSRGRELFKRLIDTADFLIETFPPGRLEELGLDFGTLRSVNQRLVLISITPFGQSGPYRDYKDSDIVSMAMSGLMSLIGEPDRPPLRVSLPQSPMWAGMYAAAGGLVAHYHREMHGMGQQVDISLQSGLLWALANAPSFWATERTFPQRNGRFLTGRSITGATMQAIFRCKDGYINFIVYGGTAGQRSNQALVDWMAEKGLSVYGLLEEDWSRFDIAAATQEQIDQLEGPAQELFLQCSKSEFLEQAFQRGILGYPVADSRDILRDDHLKARDFWRCVVPPSLGRPLRFPGPFARFSRTPLDGMRPAPDVGEHNQEIYQVELGLSAEEISSLVADQVL